MPRSSKVPAKLMLVVQVALVVLVALGGNARAQDPAQDRAADASLPKVVLVGDSIRLSYAEAVQKLLAGKATVVGPRANGGDSGNVLRNLDAWVIDERPSVVHFNCGIHDTKKFKQSGRFQVSPEQYEANLRKIVETIRRETGAVVLFATSTPIHDERAAATRRERDYELLDASIEQYNAIARRVMNELDVPVDDLNAVLRRAAKSDPSVELIVADGVHLTAVGRQLLAETVAEFVEQRLPKAE
ncbi:MAG: GDSL-type esterase/lipase family protein [Pirellulaceae bacterium]